MACKGLSRRLRSVPWVLGWSVAAAAVTALLPSALDAQAVVRGRIVDAQNDRPVADAVVQLLNPAGEPVRAAAADSLGRYLIPVPEPGRYRLRAEILGYQPQETSPFQVATDTVVVDLRVTARPVPIEGVEVSADRVSRRLRQFLGMSPGQLRIRPIRDATIRSHAERGNDLTEVMASANVPNLQALRTREGPCYQFRGRGCLPVYLDGARLNRRSVPELPLEMLSTVVVLLPNESIPYPEGAVHLLTLGFMR